MSLPVQINNPIRQFSFNCWHSLITDANLITQISMLNLSIGGLLSLKNILFGTTKTSQRRRDPMTLLPKLANDGWRPLKSALSKDYSVDQEDTRRALITSPGKSAGHNSRKLNRCLYQLTLLSMNPSTMPA